MSTTPQSKDKFPAPAPSAKKPQGSAARLIEVALSQVGYIEGPKDNQTKYGAFTKVNYQPWCGSFLMWCSNISGTSIPNTISTVAGSSAFKKKKRWFKNDGVNIPKAGDILYFDYPGDGVNRISHTEIAIADGNANGYVLTVGGNTSSDKKGDQRNGGEVCKKMRAYRSNAKRGLPNAIVGWGRPNYEATTKKPIPTKK